MEHKHLTPVAVLVMHAVTSLLNLQQSMQANRNNIYARKKHPFTSYPAAKRPKQNKLAVPNIREKPVDFFKDTMRVSTLAPAIILQT